MIGPTNLDQVWETVPVELLLEMVSKGRFATAAGVLAVFGERVEFGIVPEIDLTPTGTIRPRLSTLLSGARQ